MKKLSILFWVLAAILSHALCAVVAYNYCDMLWGIRCAGYSAPASTAFLTGIPFAAGLVLCIILALVFRRKAAAAESPSSPS